MKTSPYLLLPFSFLIISCFLTTKDDELIPELIETPAIAYDVTEVIRGDVKQVVEVDGVFVNRDRTSLYFAPVGGYLKDIYVSVGTQVRQGQLLAEIDTKELEYKYDMELLALEKAELLFRKNAGPGVSFVDQEMARISLEEQQLKTEQAFRDLTNAKIYAPFDGEIVFKDSEFARGDYIAAYDTILQIARPGTLEIMYEGTQKDIFVSGMHVNVQLKRREETIYTAEVIQTPRDTPQDEQDEFRGVVFFRVLDDIEGIRRGTECYISITLRESYDTLLIPKNLVKTNNGVNYVFVLEDSLPRERPVDIGVTSALYAEILDGLDEGERIIKR